MRTSESTWSDPRPSRHWKAALCSLSTGQEPPPSPRLRGERELAGGHEALLVREREVDAALERPERDRQPGESDDGVEHDVGLGPLEQLGGVSPTCVSGASPSIGVDPDAAATSSSPGWASTISTA